MLRSICSKSIDFAKEFLPSTSSDIALLNPSHFNHQKFLKLAKGDIAISKKLGAKLYIEFEKELAKVFDAFGFFVSHTSIGLKRADLIISTPKPASYSFLIDAKSCRTNYSLPTDDYRAIMNYVKDYRENSDILPDLKFFLIISSIPSKTLESKLKKLSNEVGMPVRFISADTFIYIVNNSNWTIFPQELLKSLTESEPILDNKWAEKLIKRIRGKKHAFTQYIESLHQHN